MALIQRCWKLSTPTLTLLPQPKATTGGVVLIEVMRQRGESQGRSGARL